MVKNTARVWVLGALGVVAIVAAQGGRETAKEAGKPVKKDKAGRVSDVGALVPAFADRVVLLVARMRARGHDAVVWETYRTPERAAKFAEAGVGSADSMHCYGLAADIISEASAWNAPADFWAALGEEARKLGLVWGGDWHGQQRPHGDKPHVQAIRVSEQRAFRAMDAEMRQQALETRFA